MIDVDYMDTTGSSWSAGWLGFQGNMLGAPDASAKPSGRYMPCALPYGLISRPRDPEVDELGNVKPGAGIITLTHGGDMWAWPTTDPRAVVKVPPTKKGGVALYSHPGAYLNFDGDHGSMLIAVPNNAGTKNHAFSIDNQGESIQCLHADGMGWTMTAGGLNSVVVKNKAGNAYVEVNDEGLVFNGNTTWNGGLVAGEVVSAQPVALHPIRYQLETQLVALVAKLATAVNGIVPDPTLATAVAAIQVLLGELATQGQSSKLSASP